MGKWYKTGFAEALEGLPADPPMNPGNRAYEDYRAGYADGDRQAARDVENEERQQKEFHS